MISTRKIEEEEIMLENNDKYFEALNDTKKTFNNYSK